MDRTIGRGGLGELPAWLEMQGLTEESLRAAVTGLGVEILGGLCARAEPNPVRVQLRALSARKFTYTMYAELCRYVESCCAGRTSGRGQGDVQERGRPDGVLNSEDEDSVGPEEEVMDPEEGRSLECIEKFLCTSFSTSSSPQPFVDKSHVMTRTTWTGSEIADGKCCTRPENSAEDQLCTGKQAELSGKFTCTKCSRRFTSEAALQVHVKKHRNVVSSDKNYKCNVCSFASDNKSAFMRHIRIHTGAKPHTCGVCGRAFGRSAHHRQHMRIHNKERPYFCTVCSKTFSYSSTLQEHMRIHTGERPYVCTVCRKTFIYASNFQRHMMIHSQERPYMCTVCAKTFPQLSSLNQHTRIHTGERPYECLVCCKTFSDLSNFQRHRRIHSPEQPYPCAVCGKTFSRLSYCKKHMATHV